MSAPRHAINHFLRHSCRIVTPPSHLASLDKNEEQTYPGALTINASGFAQFIRYVPLSIDCDPLAPLHKLDKELSTIPEDEEPTPVVVSPKKEIPPEYQHILETTEFETEHVAKKGPKIMVDQSTSTSLDSDSYYSLIPVSKQSSHVHHLDYMIGYQNLREGNSAEAFRCFLSSAKGGCLDGMVALAELFHHGIGCTKNDQKAFHWYETAAKGGDLSGQYHRATMVLSGKGTEKDTPYGLELMQNCADRGHSDAALYMVIKLLKDQDMHSSESFAPEVIRHARTALKDPGCEKKMRKFATCKYIPLIPRAVLHEILKPSPPNSSTVSTQN
ncbi:unnamed protein product, partial [Mesorhabditis spiculigera]